MNSSMAYAFRFKAEIGDIVWAVNTDRETNATCVDKVTIKEIQDNSYNVHQNEDGFSNEVVREPDFENFSIGYWVAEEDVCIGVAMYFGETLFLTEQEARIEAHNIEEEELI